MTIARGVILLASVAFAALFVWTLTLDVGLMDSVNASLAEPWGYVLFMDLNLGFVLISVLIALRERHIVRAGVWIVPMFLVGNLVGAVYLLLNLPAFADALRKQ